MPSNTKKEQEKRKIGRRTMVAGPGNFPTVSNRRRFDLLVAVQRPFSTVVRPFSVKPSWVMRESICMIIMSP